MAQKQNRKPTSDENVEGSPVEIGQRVVIKPLNMRETTVTIVGDGAPLLMCAFSQKAQNIMRARQEAGETARKDRKRAPRDFAADFEAARHRMMDGADGIPASALRNGCISACRVAGFAMTRAKLSIFVQADGFDVAQPNVGLVRLLTPDQPIQTEMPGRNADGSTDIRVRPMWYRWAARVRIRFDEDQFTVEDVFNLVNRVGQQCGILDGRPDSRESAGIGCGTFRILQGGEKLEDVWSEQGRAAKRVNGKQPTTHDSPRPTLSVVARKPRNGRRKAA